MPCLSLECNNGESLSPESAGFNRTGFVVCAYLIQVLGLSVPEALAAFADARPPGVKHEKFVVEVSSQSTVQLEL